MSHYLRLTSAIFCFALVAALTPASSAQMPPSSAEEAPVLQSLGQFVDDDNSVHESDIERLFAAGITKGCNPPLNDEFCPDDSVTRGQMAAFLRRALDLKAAEVDYFDDDTNSVFQDDINAIAASGITVGCNPPDDDRYCPDQPVTRGQMAAFLVRAFEYVDDGGGDRFTDDDSSVFETDIDRIGAAGITKGCNPPTNDRYCPEEPVTRGQMASFLSRALHLEPVAEYEIDAYIRSLGSWPDPDVSDPTETGNTASWQDAVGDVTYDCETTEYSMATAPREIVMFEPDNNILWPGALLQGSGYAGGLGSLAELPIRQRDPLQISINLLTADTTRTVENPNVATVQQAIGELIATAESRGLRPAGSVFFEQTETHTVEQAALAMGMSAKYMSARVAASLDVERAADEHTVTANFVEKAFTVSIVLPQLPSDVFSTDFTQERLQEQIDLGRIGPDNLPVFVADVTYGRILMFSMTSSRSASEIKAALSAAYNGGAFAAAGSLAYEQARLLETAQTQVVTVGGNSVNALALIRSGNLGEYFAEPSDLSAYRPISYTIRNLGDNSIASVSDTTTYNIRECTARAADEGKTGELLRVSIDRVEVVEDCDSAALGDGDMYGWFDLDGAAYWETGETDYGNGSQIDIGLEITREVGPDTTVEFSGSIKDADDVGSDDTLGAWHVVIGLDQIYESWHPGKQRTVPFDTDGPHVLDSGQFDSNCHSKLVYTIEDVGDVFGDIFNQRPVVDAGVDTRIATDDVAGLDGTVVDDRLPDPPGALTVTWTSDSGNPGDVTFADLHSIDTTATFSEEGRYQLTLQASDGELTGFDSVVVDVVANTPPTVDAGTDLPTTVTSIPAEGVTVTLNGSAEDPDGLPLHGAFEITWTVAVGEPANVEITDVGDPRTDVTLLAEGEYVLRLTATDGDEIVSDLVLVTLEIASP